MIRDGAVQLAAEMLVDAIRSAIDAERGNTTGARSASGYAARAEIQKLKVAVGRPPEDLLAFLRSRREYLDPKTAARYIGCHQESLYRLIVEQGLPAEKRGRRWRIDPCKFAAWLETKGFAPAAQNRKGGQSASK